MSDIDPILPDPGGGKVPPPDTIPPPDDPADDHIADDIREPDEGAPPIEPDPEEDGRRIPDVRQDQALRKLGPVSN